MKKFTSEETTEEKEARENIKNIAENISKLSLAVEALLGGRLKKKAILLLLANSSGEPQYRVEKILDAISTLGKVYLK